MNDSDAWDSRNISAPLNLRSGSMAMPAFTCSLGVLGNVVAIVVLCISKREQRESTFYMLVFALAVTDLSGICVLSPFTFVTYGLNRWPGGYATCQLFSFSMIFIGSTSMSVLCIMSVERYLAICRAYFYARYVSRTKACWALLVSYLVNASLCLLPFSGFGRHALQYPGTWCYLDWRTTDTPSACFTLLYALFMLVLILLTVTCNVAVCLSLFGMNQRVHVDLTPTGAPCTRRMFHKLHTVTSAAEMQMFYMLILMTIVFVVCSTPLVIRIFVNQLHTTIRCLPSKLPDYQYDVQALRFAIFNSILDPWIYILCRKNLVMRSCKRCWGINDSEWWTTGWTSPMRSPHTFTTETSYSMLPRHMKHVTDSLRMMWDVDVAQPGYHPFGVQQSEVPEKEATEKEATEKEATEKEATEKEAPENEATEKEAPENEATEKEAPENEATEKEAPENEASEEATPENEATEKEAPENEATEKEAPENEASEKEATKKEAPEKEAVDSEPPISPVRRPTEGTE